MNDRWQISFRGGLTEDAIDTLANAGILPVARRIRHAADGSGEPRSTTVWVQAADEQDAISKVRAVLALYDRSPDLTATLVNSRFYIGFPESEAAAIERAADEVRAEDPRVSMVIWSEPPGGTAELMLQLAAIDPDDAIAQADAVYAQLRTRAKLPPAKALYGFLGPTGQFRQPPRARPAHERLAFRATELFDQGSYDYAVVAAQTACEVLVFESMTELLGIGGGPGAEIFTRSWFPKQKSHTLKEEAVRDLWNALTEDEIQTQQGWWATYCDHLNLRNAVVHHGVQPNAEKAKESLDVCAKFRAHVSRKAKEGMERLRYGGGDR
jgi:hypothetical protein